MPINELGPIDTAGAGGSTATPAFVRSIGQSSLVAAAMQAFSDAMPKGGRSISPRVVEQGVIELDVQAYALEKTFNLNVTGAAPSRFGLTIRGQGSESTKFIAASNASPANFKGPDGIWRMIQIHADGSGKMQRVNLHGFGAYCDFTQNGDGSSRLTDACRIFDFDYLIESRFDDLQSYSGNFSPLTLDQFGFYIKRAYYGRASRLIANNFAQLPASGSTLRNLLGALANRQVGSCFAFEENNAFTAMGLQATGGNLAFYFKNESGLTLLGGDVETVNKGFFFDDRSNNCNVSGVRIEFHNQKEYGLEVPGETYLALFSETTESNSVQVAGGMCMNVQSVHDHSEDQSNHVKASYTKSRQLTAPLALIAGDAGIAKTPSTDLPPTLNSGESIQLTWPGAYNQECRWAFDIEPRVGAVTVRQWVKRVSGDGLLSPQLQSTANQYIYKSLMFDSQRRWENAISNQDESSAKCPLADSGHSYSSANGGELTLVTKRPHYAQRGLSFKPQSVGSLSSSSLIYVRAAPDPYTLVVGPCGNPGPIAPGGQIAWDSFSCVCLGQDDFTANWVELSQTIPVRRSVTGLALNGSNHPVLTFSEVKTSSLGLSVGSSLRLHGFKDSRLNVDYVIQAGDTTDFTLTLSTVMAPGLDVTVTARNGVDSVQAHFGYVGFRSLRYAMRSVTTSNTECVWRCMAPVITAGSRHGF